MSVDGTNTIFSSSWTIDTIIASGEKNMAVGVNDTTVINFPELGLTEPPKFIVAAKQAGASRWEQSGNRLRAKISSNGLTVNSQVSPSTNWTIRYYILS